MILDCPICRGNACFVFAKDKVAYYKCRSCNHIFINMENINSKFDYNEEYYRRWFGLISKENKINEQVSKINLMKKMNYENVFSCLSLTFDMFSSALDIGSAFGAFLELAMIRGIKNIIGVEINDYSRNYTDKFKVYKYIYEIPENTLFDLITMFDVIEHLDSPEKVLGMLNQYAKHNSFLLIETPDSSSLSSKILGKFWVHYKPLEHIHYFSRKSIKLLMERNGWECIKIMSLRKLLSMPYIVNQLTNDKFKKMQKIKDNFNSKFFIKINSGDMVCLFRKNNYSKRLR